MAIRFILSRRRARGVVLASDIRTSAINAARERMWPNRTNPTTFEPITKAHPARPSFRRPWRWRRRITAPDRK